MAGERPTWRYSLQDPQTSERRGFTDLAELTAFLAAWVARTGERDQGTGGRSQGAG